VVPHGKMLLAAAWKKTYCLLPEKKLIASHLEKNLLPPTWKKTYCLPPGKKLIASHLEKNLFPPLEKTYCPPPAKNLLPPTWKKAYCLPPGKNLLPPPWKKTYCLPPGKKLIASHLEKILPTPMVLRELYRFVVTKRFQTPQSCQYLNQSLLRSSPVVKNFG